MLTSAVFFKRRFPQAVPRMHQGMRMLRSFLTSSSNPEMQIDGYEMLDDSNVLTVQWKDGSANRYPYVHLRDNCRCSECWHSTSKQRFVDTFNDIKLNIRPRSIRVSTNGTSLAITWPDGHESVFKVDLLLETRLPESAGELSVGADPGPKHTGRPVELWDKSSRASFSRISFEDLVNGDAALYAWLDALSTMGLVYLTGAPKHPGQVERVGKRVAYVSKTMYGKTFLVSARPEAYNAAYTSGALISHNDMPYYQHNPGVQLLHCIEQAKSSGGASTFVDGFNAACQLKEQDPEAFRLLTNTPVDYETSGIDAFGEYHLRFARPTIMLDGSGNISAVAMNDFTRLGWLGVTVDTVTNVHRAYQKFTRILRDPASVVEHKMEPGDIVAVDNYRVLHGRHGYQLSEGDNRTLEGAYLEWDEIRSRLRLLGKKLGKL